MPLAICIALCLAAAIRPIQCDSTGVNKLRASLLALARDRINVWYADESNLEDPQVKDGISYRLSKEDKDCSGTGVPLTFTDFKVSGIRAVDAFNAICDVDKQPSWDQTNDAMHHLGDMHEMRARGLAAVFSAPGILKMSREFFEWQVVDANFTSDEFWIVFSTLENEDLRQMRSPTAGAVQAQNCLAGYRIRGEPDGSVHIVVTQQLNSHPWPLSARFVAGAGFSASLSWAKGFTGAAQKQAALGWNATRTLLPEWMLHDAPCGAAAPNVNLRTSLLDKAREELDVKNPGAKQSDEKLPGGETLHVWQRDGPCGNADVDTHTIPMWQVEFRIPSAQPDDVFNTIANKAQEPRWNSQVNRVRVADFSRGANDGVRGVHEELARPDGLSKWIAGPRELWEWQATNHSFETQTYLVALASTAGAPSAAFTKGSVEAAQCLAAYEVSPATNGGTKVRMVTHPNPNTLALLDEMSWLWRSISRKMLGKYAAELTAEAQRVASLRGRSDQGITDGDILELLSPTPPRRNKSQSIAQVLEAKDAHLLHDFAKLDLPHVLNTSAWRMQDFKARALELNSLAERLKANMTESEHEHFRSISADDIAVQTRGELLSAVQFRVIQQLSVEDCSHSSLPDIDGNKPEDDTHFALLLAGAITVLLLLCAAIVCCCFRCRRTCRQKRELRLAAANALLPDSSASGVDVAAA